MQANFPQRLTDWLSIYPRCALYRFVRLGNSRVNSATRTMWAARRNFYISIWRQAATAIGARFELLDEKGEMWIERNGKFLRIFVNEIYLDTKATIDKAADKPLVHRLLTKAAVVVPRHIVISADRHEPALRLLKETGGPLVVKPTRNTGGGSGVSANVCSVSQLLSAIAWARTFGTEILIEQQIEGDCYRVLLLDGVVIDCIVRHPPSVIGDGTSTILELIKQENLKRVDEGTKRSQVLIGIDPDLHNTLHRAGLTLNGRPAAGTVIRLKQAINENARHENANANGVLCPAIIETARQAAKLVGVRLAGVDIICRDPKLPLTASNGAIIEINTPPGLYYHYLTPSSAAVAEMILRNFFGLIVSEKSETEAPDKRGLVAPANAAGFDDNPKADAA